MQLTPSLQATGVPAWQSSTASQVSAPSQKRPLSQRLSSATWSQLSVASLQESRVQLTPSLQSIGAPAWQIPPVQVSGPLQKSPSSQSASTVQPSRAESTSERVNESSLSGLVTSGPCALRSVRICSGVSVPSSWTSIAPSPAA